MPQKSLGIESENMLTGMTGFGAAQRHTSWGRVIVELRSVNHRFLEIAYHFPDGFHHIEEDIKKILTKGIRRGRISFSLTFEPNKNLESVNLELAKKYVRDAKKLKNTLGLKEDIKLETILHLPGVLRTQLDRDSSLSMLPAIKEVSQEALDNLIKMRQKEGRAIREDFLKRLELMTGQIKLIKARIKKVLVEKKGQFENQEELSAFIKDSDITEEIIRMEFHIRNFRSCILKKSSDGKELDFIAQELQREINTAAAKSPDALISTSAVSIKSQVEKLREQLQNVE